MPNQRYEPYHSDGGLSVIYTPKRLPVFKHTMNLFTRILTSRWGWALKGFPSLKRAAALFRVRRHTMTSPERCRNLWDLCQVVAVKNVPGCLVECGVWRGGSAGLMTLAMRHAGQTRPLHLFDSFEGLPEPGDKDGEIAVAYSGGKGSGALKSVHKCEAGLEDVRQFLHQQLDVPQDLIHYHVGWFQNTVPGDAALVGKIAVLRLDGDWYESTRVCLEHLYPVLQPGGVLILDDYYCWEGCRKATDEYRENHGITAPMIKVDADCAYWWKP